MGHKYAKLLEPVAFGSLKLKNRTAMAPMGLVGYSDQFGGINRGAQDYYIERAKGGVGLIITGICSVNYYEIPDFGLPSPTYNPLMFSMFTKEMNEKIHSYGTKIFLQLTGGLGRSAIPQLAEKYYAPSKNTNRFDPRIEHREMTIEEIQMLIQDFVKSAVVAKNSGFDGIEVHAVHEGYLLDQFAIKAFNQRTDEYGGDLKARLKISTDIVKGIKQACGKDFPVSLRYSVKSYMKGLRQGALPGEEFEEYGKDFEEGIEAAKILVEAGYDFLNVDAGTYDSWYWNHPPMYFEEGMYREFGRMIKEAVDVPVILAGRMENPDMAVESIGRDADLIAYGRPLLTDPYLVEKIRKDELEDIRPCLSCHQGCMGRIGKGQPISCAVNPACGRESRYGVGFADELKDALVIGGGVAGMEAARVLALRGHNVTLVEATDQLGGNLIPGGTPEFKKDDRKLVNWYEYQLDKLDVEIILETKADKEYIEQFDPDVIIVATGSKPIIPEFAKNDRIVQAVDVLNGISEVSGDITILGGGLVGGELALHLTLNGEKVRIIEMMPDILGGPHNLPFMNYDMLKDLLIYNNVEINYNTKVVGLNDKGLEVEDENGTRSIETDSIILALGYKCNKDLVEEIQDIDIPFYNIGDSLGVDNIMKAIWDA
ncbi:MAG TPA: FAD-dependent oxidoreductase [Tissierellaceae bacterium]|nr:FAD-dependent oxidoreductase [Tissierellaceae bacterium]